MHVWSSPGVLLSADGELRGLQPKPTADVLNPDERIRIAHSVKPPCPIDPEILPATLRETVSGGTTAG